ncbi:enamine deaminase RidA (YjgF/YER057c/UK114 family) [Stella humosa]|uniref:Enamine deaminase RidA (YjgF/YER057c/UK114 family) n=1 Tax=Stella humosa TaxID=94 RepID=A0A3N1KUE2_9PROT|nr:RidA family protein [Stella humosa]ROP83092.1 enamine deaminase RidA (YjgF/YER057c/UK114 family) [Stella humosa]BBK30131.1 enamine deaminase RidA [Stella humosa]
MNRAFNPPGVAPPAGNGYSHGIEVPAGARMLFAAGQVGTNPDGTVPPDVGAQTDRVFENIKAILAGAGMGMEDLVKINVLLVSSEHLAAFREARGRHLAGYRPASTLAIVAALASPAFLVEVEVIAAKSP